MLKTSYTQDNKELKMWVDPNDGSLNVSIDGKSVNVPDHLGKEMLNIMQTKQKLYFTEIDKIERTKMSFWTRLVKYFTFKDYLTGHQYEAV